MSIIELAHPGHAQALKACETACITQNHPVDVSRYGRTILQARTRILVVRCNAYEARQVLSRRQETPTAIPAVNMQRSGAMPNAQVVPASMLRMQTETRCALTSLLFEQVAQQATNPAGLTKD